METTRQRIITLIQDHQVVTTAEISHRLKITPADVRHHLSLLIEQGIVSVIGPHTTGKPGRPSRIFALTKPIARHNLDLLLHLLLTDLAGYLSPDVFNDRLKALVTQMTAGFDQKTGNPTQRLYHAIEFLNTLNYDAHWEAHAASPRVIFGHCPYASIISGHPEICHLDKFLLDETLGQPVTQIEKLTVSPRGLRRCVFMREEK